MNREGRKEYGSFIGTISMECMKSDLFVLIKKVTVEKIHIKHGFPFFLHQI